MVKRVAREILSYLAVLVVGVILTLQIAPAKVRVETRTAPAPVAPAHAVAFMRALCDRDVEYIVKHVDPFSFPVEMVRAYETAPERIGTKRCATPRYLGSFAGDRHVFVARFIESNEEGYWVITFESGLVTDIE